jgi:hypothetical protein
MYEQPAILLISISPPSKSEHSDVMAKAEWIRSTAQPREDAFVPMHSREQEDDTPVAVRRCAFYFWHMRHTLYIGDRALCGDQFDKAGSQTVRITFLDNLCLVA